jgi:hypothetical protein
MAKAATKTCDRPLSTFQLAFGQAFYSTSSETYGNRTKSAIVAGYSAKTAQQQGGQLAKHPGIRARFSGLANANPAVAAVEEEITRGLVIKDLRRIQGLAEDDEDWGTALRAEELIGKTAGIFIDVVGFDPQQLKQLTEAQEREARRISSLILDNESATLQTQPSLPAPRLSNLDSATVQAQADLDQADSARDSQGCQ